jgi:YVTN family beta-propeller protein
MSNKPRRLERYWLLIPLALVGVIALVILEATILNLTVSESDLALEQIADIPLAGGPNRFDYQSLDPTTGLLYLTHSASNLVTIFDTVNRKIVADIPGIADPHDVAVASDLGRVFVTSATDNLVAVVDAHRHTILARIPVGKAPDGLVYDPAQHKVFVADEDGQNDAVIDARSERRIAEIPLGGIAGDVEYDALSHHVLAVVETLNQLVTIDPVSDRIIARSALAGCQGAQDQVLDVSQRLAFVDCIDNATLVMVDLRSMRVLSTQSTGKSPDLMALDTGWHYLYIAAESGVVSVFDEQGRTLRELNKGYIAPGAHSVAVNQKTHDLYFPLQDMNGQPILRIALFQAK